MPDDNNPNTPPQPSGGAYSQGEKISKINVADEIKKWQAPIKASGVQVE